MNNTSYHIPVLKNEVLTAFSNLKDNKNDYIIDCTCGFGGHCLEILANTKNIKLICNDKDSYALDFCKTFLDKYKNRIIFSDLDFSDLINKYKNKNIVGILADIGVSSYQLDSNKRGFGFNSDFLDMRMNAGNSLDITKQSNALTAKNIINSYTNKQLEQLFKKYDVREFKKISNLICAHRPFKSAKTLATLIQKHSNKHKKHSATLIFQAIRIEVNNELYQLEKLLKSIEINYLQFGKNNCIVCIISFHSLEDKIVKNYFRSWSKNCICENDVFKCECGNNNKKGDIKTKKPINPTKKEIIKNPRSSSSKMRIFELKQ